MTTPSEMTVKASQHSAEAYALLMVARQLRQALATLNNYSLRSDVALDLDKISKRLDAQRVRLMEKPKCKNSAKPLPQFRLQLCEDGSLMAPPAYLSSCPTGSPPGD